MLLLQYRPVLQLGLMELDYSFMVLKVFAKRTKMGVQLIEVFGAQYCFTDAGVDIAAKTCHLNKLYAHTYTLLMVLWRYC